MFYHRLTAEQVTATYHLFMFLERLRVIDHVIAHTESSNYAGPYIFDIYELHDLTGAEYSIIKDGYTCDSGHIEAITNLERIFGKLATKQLRGTD